MSNLKGSFQDAVADIDHVLHIRGRVLPVADKPLTLKAVLSDGKEIIGESNINEAKSLHHIFTISQRNDAVANVTYWHYAELFPQTTRTAAVISYGNNSRNIAGVFF